MRRLKIERVRVWERVSKGDTEVNEKRKERTRIQRWCDCDAFQFHFIRFSLCSVSMCTQTPWTSSRQTDFIFALHTNTMHKWIPSIWHTFHFFCARLWFGVCALRMHQINSIHFHFDLFHLNNFFPPRFSSSFSGCVSYLQLNAHSTAMTMMILFGTDDEPFRPIRRCTRIEWHTKRHYSDNVLAFCLLTYLLILEYVLQHHSNRPETTCIEWLNYAAELSLSLSLYSLPSIWKIQQISSSTPNERERNRAQTDNAGRS